MAKEIVTGEWIVGHISQEFKDPINEPTIKVTQSTVGGVKFDGDKPRVDLLPAVALEEIAKVLTFGAKKYASWNWAKGISYSRLLGAGFRHLLSYMRGEDKDKESGLSHLAHLGCCVVFLLWHERFRKDLDDRFIDPDLQQLKETK